MTITWVKKPVQSVAPDDDTPPWVAESALKALKKKDAGATTGLCLVRKGTNRCYDVIGVAVLSPDLARVKLRSQDGMLLSVNFGEREEALYEPLWR